MTIIQNLICSPSMYVTPYRWAIWVGGQSVLAPPYATDEDANGFVVVFNGSNGSYVFLDVIDTREDAFGFFLLTNEGIYAAGSYSYQASVNAYPIKQPDPPFPPVGPPSPPAVGEPCDPCEEAKRTAGPQPDVNGHLVTTAPCVSCQG